MKVELGASTEYGFSLPLIRKKLSEPFLLDGNILDYGCGNGANTILFDYLQREIIGIDVEQERINEARQYAELHDIDIRYEVYDGEKLPFADGMFANVVSFEVIEHTENDTEAVCDVCRVLRVGGHFLLTVPNKRYPMETHGFHGRLAQYIPTNRIPFLSWLPTILHEKYANARIYTKSRIISLVEGAGFEIVTHSYIMPPLDKVKIGWVKKILLFCIRLLRSCGGDFFGVSHFIVCRKK